MFRRALALTLALGLAPLASGCFLDGTAFQAAGGGGGGAAGPAGGGGEGGTTGGATSTGSAGGDPTTTGATTGGPTTTGATTGSSTTSADPECKDDEDCPPPPDECAQARCMGGVCGSQAVADGTECGAAGGECEGTPKCLGGACTPNPLPAGHVLPDGDAHDCKLPVCDGNGNKTTMPDDDQVPDSTTCSQKTCEGGVVMQKPQNDGEECLGGLGECCDGKCCDEYCFLCL